MYEIISGLPPYHDVDHNKNLAITICQGLRPRFKIKVPQLIVHLIKKCLDANSSDRPTANEIEEVLYKWYYMPSDNQTVNLQLEIKNAEVINNNLSDSNIPSTNLGLYEIHPEAIYTSRLLKFYDDTIGVESLESLQINISQLNINNNLPEPKNSDDYYKQNDNIISEEFLEYLQNANSQLKIDDIFSKPKNSVDYHKKDVSMESSASSSLQIDISHDITKNSDA
ncbi:uncharacterized protein OCT59_012416 [Rhizophagus irregularis]|nr:hypothetical protein OCT59_012416 [Rhizophagus irregularis]